MQNTQLGKVSMVVPCYNKELYIGAMLDSVIAQEWDNIELILVNDGSTDGTRKVIESYLPKIEKRGYDVKVIDQENGGCCKAVHTGLINMTGDYYCLVDADDEIELQYVSTMASWLDEHDECKWTACSYKAVNLMDGNHYVNDKIQHQFTQDTDDLLVHYVFRKVITMAWVYMMRVSFMEECGLIDNFYTGRNKTYEPLVVVPAAVTGEKLKYFDVPLYRYNLYASDLYGFDSLDKAKEYYDDYLEMYIWAFNQLDITEEEKNRYIDMARLSYQLELFKQLTQIMNAQSYKIGEETIALFGEVYDEDFNMGALEFKNRGYEDVFKAVENRYLRKDKKFSRIIGYGALGKNAKALLPLLVGSRYCPNELWDISGDGYRVKQPDFDSLTEDDVLIVFPKKKEVVQELKEKLEDCPGIVYYYNDIDYILAELKFPQLSGVEV